MRGEGRDWEALPETSVNNRPAFLHTYTSMRSSSPVSSTAQYSRLKGLPISEGQLRPDRKVIRGDAGLHGAMDADGIGDESGAGDDAVEAGHGYGGWKAAARRNDTIARVKQSQALGNAAPFVHIAHDDRSDVTPVCVQLRHDGGDLTSAHRTQKTQMSRNDAEQNVGNLEFSHHCATRFQHGQVKPSLAEYTDRSPHEDCIAMPAKTGVSNGNRNHGIVRP